MIRFPGLCCALLLLTTCVGPSPAPASLAAAPHQCRVGPDGGPLVSERGIGGTGAPARAVASADGGDRGIGGTGIVGVVTGFASVCVNGVEVAYDSATPVAIDGTAAAPAALRVGQVVVLDASGAQDRLFARSIAVRHQVIGPIQTIADHGTVLTVAGQQVLLDGAVPGAAHLAAGQWIAVSGLVGIGGAIHATRIDPAPDGMVLVRGTLRGTADAPAIGQLALHPQPGQTVAPGSPVIVRGRFADGALQTGHLQPDLLDSDPAAYFGAGTQHYLIETYAAFGGGHVEIDGGLQVPVAGGAAWSGAPSRAILSLQKTPDGGLAVTGAAHPGTGTPLFAPAGGNQQGGGGQGLAPAPFEAPEASRPAPHAAGAVGPDQGGFGGMPPMGGMGPSGPAPMASPPEGGHGP